MEPVSRNKAEEPTDLTNVGIIFDDTSKSYHRFEVSERDEVEQSKENNEKKESPLVTFLSVLFPFFIAGFGMVGAGILLDLVTDWPLYKNVEEIIILVPALLGLKGNLEMTLASRLSTQVNIGLIHDKKTIISAMLGNSAIIQLQSIVVGFLAAFLATIFELVYTGNFLISHMSITIASSVATASLASLLLATLVMTIIIISHRFNINPDNIATPIASSLGDVVTLAILSAIGTLLYQNIDNQVIHIGIISVYVIAIPFLAIYSYKNEFVRDTLIQGWIPILMAMLISSGAGAILKKSNQRYPIVAMFQPVINGVGGNLVAIFASRLSTSIHRTTSIGSYPIWSPKSYLSYPYATFFGNSNPESKTAQILMMLVLPGHLTFFFTLYFIKKDENDIELSFLLVLFYMVVAFLQVIILFLICFWLVLLVWKLKKDPDNVCIPYLTATGDFLGVVFLLFAFHMAFLAGNETLIQTTTRPMLTMNITNSSIESTLSY